MNKEPIIIDRTYPVQIEKVWNAITAVDQMREWYFPMIPDFRPEPGFETEFDVVKNNKHYLHIWKVIEVIPGKKISYKWSFNGYPGDTLVTFELSANDKGTKLTLTHEKLESFRGDLNPGLNKENFREGWSQIIGTALKDYLDKTSYARGETGMVIKRPVAEVFEAFVNPDLTEKFWFTGSTGKLENGKEVIWSWDMYDHHSKVLVKDFVPDKKIIIEWGAEGQDRTSVEWNFESIKPDQTFVTILSFGFKGDNEAILNQVSASVGGFSWVLAGLKAYLEYEIQLNLVADRYPKGKH